MPNFAEVMKELEKERDIGDDLSPRDMVGRPEQSPNHQEGQRHEDQIEPNSDAADYLSPDDSDESAKHAYIDKEVDQATGTITYYYENGVKSIHHPDPKKNTPGFHKQQAANHRQQAQDSRLFDDKAALSHLTAAHGHDLAGAAKERAAQRYKDVGRNVSTWASRVGQRDEDIADLPELDDAGMPKRDNPKPSLNRPRRNPDRGPVENMEKSHLSTFTDFLSKDGAIGTVDGVGTVAVSSDPGVFSPTYGDRSPIKQKKKKSGVAKLDQFLRQKNKKVEKFATDVVQGALQDLREYDIMKSTDAKSIYKADGKEAPKAKEEPKLENPDKESKPAKVQSPPSIYKEDNEEFYSLFKDYFEYLDKEQESTDDSRDGEERLDSEETGGSDLD